ncbi:MAG: hypothetical protein LBC70_10385 [Chitinispirillales bacterium]|jgi:hypothetical protein|nr:hypothetical protein [Chitinispirillales bacterium]
MSQKMKVRMEKVAIVMAALVAIVVGVAVAQMGITVHPIYGTTNPASDMANLSGTLDINFEVQNFAALFVIPTPPTAGASIDTLTFMGMDPVNSSAVNAVGNVGYVVVETNYREWDVLVHAANGGYLMRPANANETPDPWLNAPAPLWDGRECVAWGTPALPMLPPPCIEYDTLFAEPSTGIYLRHAGGGLTGSVPVRLQIGIGTLTGTKDTPAPLGADTSMLRLIEGLAAGDFVDEADNAESYVYLDSIRAYGYASFVMGLRDSVVTANPMKIAATGQGAMTATTHSFNAIRPFSIDATATDSGSVHGMIDPRRTSSAMAFYVNARLNLHDTDIRPTAANNTQLSGNMNGIYSETLTFTFWGRY